MFHWQHGKGNSWPEGKENEVTVAKKVKHGPNASAATKALRMVDMVRHF